MKASLHNSTWAGCTKQPVRRTTLAGGRAGVSHGNEALFCVDSLFSSHYFDSIGVRELTFLSHQGERKINLQYCFNTKGR